MQKECGCEHHHNQPQSKTTKIDHIIRLLQDNFISPYKVLYLLDPKQADHFKSRNQSSGCCSSNHITVLDQNLTKTEKHLKQLISYSALLSDLDSFLASCNQKIHNIVQSGKKDNLKVTPQVEKFLLDKVMMESINHLLFTKLSKKIQEESINNNKEIGLWATPATWYQRYPNHRLDFLPGQFLSSLLTKDWAILPNYASNQQQLLRQLAILEKDGKFQQSNWLVDKKLKILNNPQRFIQIKTSNGCFLFEQTRELIIKLSSIPFQLNAKANLFCTVSPNLHIVYSKQAFITQKLKGSLRYTLIINIGGNIKMKINDELIQMQDSSLLLLDNTKSTFSIQNQQDKQIFLFFNYIGCVQKR